MEREEDYVPISALQHHAFCPRQCALIHLERIWDENRLTAEGRLIHETAHSHAGETRPGVHIARGVPLVSHELQLTGQADVVEFRRSVAGDVEGLARLPLRGGVWSVLPIEYKRGKPKRDHCDEIQLCAQALCLEEMLGIEILKGALYYWEMRRRTEVRLGPQLRDETREQARRVRELLHTGVLPRASADSRCRSCSLREPCMPDQARTDAAAYVRREARRAASLEPST